MSRLILVALIIANGTVWGQEEQRKVDIEREVVVEGEIGYRRIIKGAEPDIGIDWSVERGKNPVKIVKTSKAIYFFNPEGQIERTIPLAPDTLRVEDGQPSKPEDYRIGPDGKYYMRYEYDSELGRIPVAEEDQQLKIITEDARMGPNGQYYMRYKYDPEFGRLFVLDFKFYNHKSDLLFEIKEKAGQFISRPYISPNGKYWINLFDQADFGATPFIEFYSMKGKRIKRIDFNGNFVPISIDFNNNGDQLEVRDAYSKTRRFYNSRGELVRQGVAGESENRTNRIRRKVHRYYRKLATQEVNRIADPSGHMTGNKEVKTLKLEDRGDRGVYCQGNRLYILKGIAWE